MATTNHGSPVPPPPAPTPSATTCTLTPGCAFAPGHTGKCFGRFRPVPPASAPAAMPEPDVRCTECGGVITANEASLAERIHRPCKMLRDQRPTAEEAEPRALREAWKSIRQGAEGNGARLSARECQVLTAQATELAALRARETELTAALVRVMTWNDAGFHDNGLPPLIVQDLRAALAPRQPEEL